MRQTVASKNPALKRGVLSSTENKEFVIFKECYLFTQFGSLLLFWLERKASIPLIEAEECGTTRNLSA